MQLFSEDKITKFKNELIGMGNAAIPFIKNHHMRKHEADEIYMDDSNIGNYILYYLLILGFETTYGNKRLTQYYNISFFCPFSEFR